MQTSRRSILKGSILASLAGTMGATATVSYTHLDVYKRQVPVSSNRTTAR